MCREEAGLWVGGRPGAWRELARVCVLLSHREAYDPSFRGQKATEDLEVPYHYEKLGCPILVYYDTPWKPVVEL